MAKTFGAASTTDDVLEGVDLSGKRILVTGVSAGLGVETARTLAAHGALVVGAARDLSKAKAATEQVRAGAAKGGGLETRRTRSRLARQRARLRRRSGRRRQAFRCRHRQRRRHGDAEGADGRRLRDPVRHQPPRPFRAGQPHRLVDLSPARAWSTCPRPGIAIRTSISTIPISSARPMPSSWPMAARRPPTSCSPSSSTAGTRPTACAPTAVHPGVIHTELARHMSAEAPAGADRSDQRGQCGVRTAAPDREEHSAGRCDFGLGRRRRPRR